MFVSVHLRVLAVSEPEQNHSEPVAPSPKPAAQHHWSRWLALIVVLIAVVWGWRHLREDERAAQTAQSTQELAEKMAALEQRLELVQRNHQSISNRLESGQAANQVLREELFGMGERAALLEDAVARLTQSRAGSETVLRLNETEFLLLIGGERLRLFGDVPGAVQAYSLAESALASLDDPQLATLRQTLAQELLALRAAPADPRPQVRAELALLARKLPSLRSADDARVVEESGEPSKLMTMLSSVVTVRRVDPGATLLGPAQRQAALAAIALKLELAQAALARPDQIAFGDALAEADAAARGLFDESDAQVKQWFDDVKRLRETALVPELPVLGATLRELNALRASRAIAAPVRPLVLPEEPAPLPASSAAPVSVPQDDVSTEAAAPALEIGSSTPETSDEAFEIEAPKDEP